jgi:glycosyltransferase involved in cell wall biosynthesis
MVLRAGRSDTPVPLRKVAFLGNYMPRQCGLATFTADLRGAIAARYPSLQCPVVAVNDRPLGYDYPSEVRFEIFEPDLSAYRRAADFLNLLTADVLCLQHEFGIFGGPAGSHVLTLMRAAGMPIVTTLHTILQNPTLEQRRVFLEVVQLSQRLVVMSKKAADFLREIYHVAEEKIDTIPHGIPNLVRDHGEAYRSSLETLARKNGIESHVLFFNRFVELEELTKFIGAADIYITPYLKQEQITSGALAYGFGSGKAVVSTPYWHAAELLADDRGILVPFGDPGAIARAIDDLLSDETRRKTMSRNAYRVGREMVWSNVAQMYVASFECARRKRCESPSAISDSQAEAAAEDFAAVTV